MFSGSFHLWLSLLNFPSCDVGCFGGRQRGRRLKVIGKISLVQERKKTLFLVYQCTASLNAVTKRRQNLQYKMFWILVKIAQK